MAKCVGLKEKSAWTTVSIPQQLRNDHQFDSLVEIQELTDYELLSSNVDLFEQACSRPGLLSNRKRKRERSETAAVSSVCATEPTNKKSKNRRKQKKAAENNTCKVQQTVEYSTGSDDERPDLQASIAHQHDTDMSQWKHLYVPDMLLQALQDEGFDTPTPIQSLVLPSAIRDRKDILAAAETGSGKTLAFGIPIFARILCSRLDAAKTTTLPDDAGMDDGDLIDPTECTTPVLKTGQEQPLLALILEPTRELAVQVKKHLTTLARHTNITLATVVGGMSIEKQRRILGKRPHVVIATPGRLWQLVEEGNEHLSQIDQVLCLVVDEADRMIEKGHYEELTKLLEMMNKSPRQVKKRQTFVMSATLTMDVAAPKRVTNKKKQKMANEDKLKTLTERICVGQKPKVIDLTPKDKVAQTLTELRVNCKADEKDFYLYYFLSHHPGRTLVFANSKDCLRRLVSLLTLLKCSPLPLHADMQQRQRLKNLDKFAASNRGLLVASDVAARGLDIPNVDHVIHYQNYIHRSGRTARASNLGLSVMFVAPEDARDYRKIVHGVRNGEELPILSVDTDFLPAVKHRVALARNIDVTEYRMKKKRLKNNFFTKAAEEMDMIIDESNLLEDTGDEVMQAEEKQLLTQMKAQLSSALQRPLAPLHMTKYLTKSGHLLSKKVVNLHHSR
ncbi:hypothetical protein BsWGS_19955 [Bradybaena similaris]